MRHYGSLDRVYHLAAHRGHPNDVRSVTGGGLARALGQKFPRPLVAVVSLGLLVANTITVGADLSAMADAGEMLSGLNSHYYVVFFGVIIGRNRLWEGLRDLRIIALYQCK